MRKRNKLSKILAVALFLAVHTVLPVAAQEIPETAFVAEQQQSQGEQLFPDGSQLNSIKKEKEGSITITLTDGRSGTSKAGVEFRCIKAAEIEGGEYYSTTPFQASGVDFAEIKNADALDRAAETLNKMADNAKGYESGKTSADGKLIFSELEVGVYLLSPIDCDSYDTITPVLIAIPTWDEQNGEMMYDVSTEPKHTVKAGTLSVYAPNGGGRFAPQTGIDDVVTLYMAGAVICLCIAMLFAVKIKCGKNEKKNL